MTQMNPYDHHIITYSQIPQSQRPDPPKRPIYPYIQQTRDPLQDTRNMLWIISQKQKKKEEQN